MNTTTETPEYRALLGCPRSDYVQYEHAVIEYHNTFEKSCAWHWERIPEDILWESGYITDYSKQRHQRLMKAKKGENPLRDYGLDGIHRMIVDGRTIYGGLQMKYFDKSKVTAKHIGSFFNIQSRMRLKYPESQGFLYSTTRLEPELKDSCKDPNFIIQHRLYPWKPKAVQDEQNICETQIPLRSYQIECRESLKTHPRNIMFIPCGLGKTLIAGYHLRSKQYPFILAIAPLKISVQNLQTRLTPFLPEYKTLLVDSDSNGTTDLEEIEKFLLDSDSKRIIFSTYKSTVDILMERLDPEHMCILVDEIHNATEELCYFISQFPEFLGMTATLPDEVRESLPEDTQIFKVSLSDAIRDGYLVDYTVWFPERVAEIPGSLLDAKAFYLANSMLKTGSRRCIAYLSNIQECSDFQVLFKRVMREYHGMDVWTAQIDCSIPAQRRTEILDQFQNSDFAVLMSVRVLDEAVDIPRCDSEFIGQIGEKSSDIRMIQRWGRGSRLDPRNLTKHNNIFIWTLDWNECVNVLSRLKEVDPEFHKKIKLVATEYDNQGSKEVIERIHIETQEFRDWSKITCESYDDRRMKCVELLLEFVEKMNRVPKREEIYKDYRIGYFWGNLKNRQEQEWFKRLSHNDILRLDYQVFIEKRRNRLNSDKVIQLCVEFADNFKRGPKRREVYKNFNIGHTWCSFKMGRLQQYAHILLSNPILKAEHEEFIRHKEIKISSEEKVKLLLEFVDKYKRLPKVTEEYNGVLLRIFWSGMKKYKNSQFLKQLLENPILKENYEYHPKKITPEMKAHILLEFVNQMGRVPIGTDEYKNIKIGQFWGSIKQGYNKNILPLLLENPILKPNYDKYQENKSV